MALRYIHTFAPGIPVADYVTYEGWTSTSQADTPTDVTTAAALWTPPGNGPGGDTHVATCTALAALLPPRYLDLGAGSLDRGIWCFRMIWVSGDGTAGQRLFAIADASSTAILQITAAFSGAGTRLQIGSTQGTKSLVQGVAYAVAIVYDYSLTTPTIDVYIDGELDLSVTDTGPQTVGYHVLGSHGTNALISYNSLRFYTETTGTDLVQARKVNTRMRLGPPNAIELVDTVGGSWTQFGSPTSDLDAVLRDQTTGLERDQEGEIRLQFEPPADLFGASILAVSVVALGTSDNLVGIAQLTDSGGEAASAVAEELSAPFSVRAVSETDSDGNPYVLGGSDGAATLDYGGTIVVGAPSPWIPFYPLAGTGILTG